MQDKLLFETLQNEIDKVQELRQTYARSDFDSSMKYTADKELCIRIEALEDLRTALVAKGFFSE